jgi:hypothetical protein
VVLRSSALSLSDGEYYSVSLRSSGGKSVSLFSARVLAKYTAITKLPIPRTVFDVLGGIGTAATTTSDFIFWDPAQYSAVSVEPAAVEHMIRTAAGVTVTSSLWDGTAESYSVSLSGAHDLVMSSATALPPSVMSYKGRGVASASNTTNRIRLWRLIVPVTLLTSPVSVVSHLAGEWLRSVGVSQSPVGENLDATVVFHDASGEYSTTAAVIRDTSGEYNATAAIIRGFNGEVLNLIPVSRVLHGEWYRLYH